MITIKHYLVLTAFGKFAGVLHNPTSTLSSTLPALLPPHIQLLFNQDCDQAIIKIYKEIQKILQEQQEARVVVIHLGVASGRSFFSLQKCSKNIMKFRVPDQRGNCPCDQPIRKQCVKTSLQNQLDLGVLATNLRGMGHQVQESVDCGEYICNYLYYRSLEQGVKEGRVRRLFVHVPSFSKIDESRQSNFLIDLIMNLKWN